ncbi:polymorphic toxin-type HINT domain-containing protein [Paenibacillus sp. MMS18-CY102]|uniref:polymorphic toxin-type HINT domain-containing protein n=1 Tax=Paenibacillus sp. MMS18-CY102 TaxID=2682849 RepID=UPI003FA6DBEF
MNGQIRGNFQHGKILYYAKRDWNYQTFWQMGISEKEFYNTYVLATPGGGMPALYNSTWNGSGYVASIGYKGGAVAGKPASGRSGCDCFTAGTKVLTDEGEKPIEEIEVGDKVLAKDDETGEMAYKEVEWLFQRDVEETYNITVGGEIITTTEEHPFWIVNKGWIKSKDLVVGYVLTTSDGKELAIEKIEVKKEHKTVYNFMVNDFHTYFVSNLGIWTHNACKPINLPSYKSINIDMDHITSGHTAGGSRAKQSGGKTIFPSNMSESQIEKTVREAYKNGSKVQTQGDRVLVRGEANGVQVEMWVNTKTNTIETAYPIN